MHFSFKKVIISLNSTSAMVHVHALEGQEIVEMMEEERDPTRALEYPLGSPPATVASQTLRKSVTGWQTLTAATAIRAL